MFSLYKLTTRESVRTHLLLAHCVTSFIRRLYEPGAKGWKLSILVVVVVVVVLVCVFARCSLRVLYVAVFGDFFGGGRIFRKINVCMQI